MEITTIFNLLREFGPLAVMFVFGLWGIHSTWTKSVKDLERVEKKDNDMIKYFMEALDKRDSKKQKEHDEAAKYRKEVIYQCNNFAKEIIKATGADHVAIYDYCNGTQSLSGIPFLHFRAITEKKAGFKFNPIHEKMDINTLGVFLLDLEKDQKITIKNIKKEEENYPELACFMGLKKQHKGIFANVVGLHSSLGFISVTFSHNKKVDYVQLEKVVYTYVLKVSNLLDYSNINS